MPRRSVECYRETPVLRRFAMGDKSPKDAEKRKKKAAAQKAAKGASGAAARTDFSAKGAKSGR
jgi:hypothetical protein